MINFTEISSDKFNEKKEKFDMVLGKVESNCPKFYEVLYLALPNVFSIGLINNYPNMDLDPQVEIKDTKIIIGNNETLFIIDVATKEKKEFTVFPYFYKFFICGERIIVMSEAVVFCLLEDELIWSVNNFEDMISFESIDENYVTVSKYETHEEVSIDIITGKVNRRNIRQ